MSTAARTTWLRVSRRRRCPVCGKPDWCTVSADGTAAICPRTPSDKWVGQNGGGYLHKLDARQASAPRAPDARRAPEPTLSGPELQLLERQFRSAVNPERLARFAESMGLEVASLEYLGIGWSDRHRAWTFPMYGQNLRGFRLRSTDGRKWSVKGGREGLFVPCGAGPRSPLLVCEGPTSCAALLDLGLSAIGRPSCSGGVELVVEWLRGWPRHSVDVVVLGDHDEAKKRPDGSVFRPGQEGAERLAGRLCAAGVCKSVKVLVPPFCKDARDWKLAGATRATIEACIRATPYWRRAA